MIVGSAQVDITPKPGIELSGFAARQQPSTAVLDPLAVRALYLEDGPERLLWLGADILGVEDSFVAELRGCIQRELGIPAPGVLLSVTHTHSGPPTVRLTGCGEYDARYVEWFMGRCLQAARLALADLEPCEFLAVEGRCELGVDRRGAASAHTDPRVAAVGWRRADGTFKAVLLNYAMHGVGLSGTEISADWPGAASRTLSQSLPGQPIALVCSGASGNIDPPAVGVSPEQMQQWGRQVAESVLPALCRAAVPEAGAGETPAPQAVGRQLKMASATVPLPVENWTVAKIVGFTDRCLADDAGRREFGDKYRLAVETWRGMMLARLRRGEPLAVNAELTAVALGPVAFVTANAEIFSQFNELIALRDGTPVYAVGCTNGMLGYLPTSAAFCEGGYEIDWSMLFYNRVRPMPGSLELLAEQARSLLARLTTGDSLRVP
jgi:neutral ceramidase